MKGPRVWPPRRVHACARAKVAGVSDTGRGGDTAQVFDAGGRGAGWVRGTWEDAEADEPVVGIGGHASRHRLKKMLIVRVREV